MRAIGIILDIPHETSFDEREALVEMIDDWTFDVRERMAALGFRVTDLSTSVRASTSAPPVQKDAASSSAGQGGKLDREGT